MKDQNTQDALSISKRVWAAVFGVASAVLMVPEVQNQIVALVAGVVPPSVFPIVTALMSAALSSISKYNDKRPVA